MTEIKVLTGSSTKKSVYIIIGLLFLLPSIGLFLFGILEGFIFTVFAILFFGLFVYEHSKKIYLKINSKTLLVIDSVLFFKEQTTLEMINIKKVVVKEFTITRRGGNIGGPVTYQSATELSSSKSFVHGILLVMKNQRNVVLGKGMKEEDAKQIKYVLDDFLKIESKT